MAHRDVGGGVSICGGWQNRKFPSMGGGGGVRTENFHLWGGGGCTIDYLKNRFFSGRRRRPEKNFWTIKWISTEPSWSQRSKNAIKIEIPWFWGVLGGPPKFLKFPVGGGRTENFHLWGGGGGWQNRKFPSMGGGVSEPEICIYDFLTDWKTSEVP